jgi:diacylglycerol kinase (ATP)
MKNTIKFSSWILKRTNNIPDVLIISLITFLFVVILCLLTKRKRQLFMNRYKSNHNWNFNDLITVAHNCNVCEANIVLSSGIYCDTCQVYVDEKCFKKADKKFKCKLLCKTKSSGSMIMWKHSWIKGNLPMNSICFKCEQVCGNTPVISDFKCVWCMRKVHENCLNEAKSDDTDDGSIHECDFGVYSNFILKPNFLFSTKQVNNKYYFIDDVEIDFKMKDFMSDWTPLIIFANTKSGSNDADMIMKHFRGILNPLQVININNIDPEKVFKWMAKYSDLVQFNILVCGGDGSVGWLLEIAAKFNFKVRVLAKKKFSLYLRISFYFWF